MGKDVFPLLQEGARGRSCPLPLHEGGNAGRATTRVAPTGDDDRDAITAHHSEHPLSFRAPPVIPSGARNLYQFVNCDVNDWNDGL